MEKRYSSPMCEVVEYKTEEIILLGDASKFPEKESAAPQRETVSFFENETDD